MTVIQAAGLDAGVDRAVGLALGGADQLPAGAGLAGLFEVGGVQTTDAAATHVAHLELGV
ncbi:hypothetical protein D9M68_917880 [compost metagenome]